jgi:Zn-dependent peptidase ImmA (M78 family)
MHPDSDVAERTCSAICEEFQVSRLAATVRLEKLGVLSRATPLNI